MTNNTDHDFQQFRGVFDAPLATTQSFAARMEKLMSAEGGSAQKERPTAVLASPAIERSTPEIARRNHPLAIAAAVLTVLAVVVSSIWVLSGDVLQADYASAPSGLATVAADAPGTPGADVQLVAQRFPGVGESEYLLGVTEGVMLSSDSVIETDDIQITTLRARDASSGERLWEIRDFDLGEYSSNGEVLVGHEYSWSGQPSGFPPARDLVAIDLQSGDVLWRVAVSDNEEFRNENIDFKTPVIVGQLVVIAEATGSLQAFDLADGSAAWETSFDRGTGYESEYWYGESDASVRTTQYPLSAIEWRGYVVVINGDGVLQVFDGQTGTPKSTHEIEFQETDIVFTYGTILEGLPNGVLTARDDFTGNTPRAELKAIDPLTGEILWERGIEGQVWLTEPGAGTLAVQSSLWQESNWLLRLIGRDSYTSYQYFWIDAKTGDDILATERSRQDFTTYMVTDGHYACAVIETLICYDRAGTRHVVDIEPWGEPILADGILYIHTPEGLMTVDLP